MYADITVRVPLARVSQAARMTAFSLLSRLHLKVDCQSEERSEGFRMTDF